MNRTYKSVYNESTGTFVAVAENVKAKGKRSSSRVKTTLAGLVAAVALVAGSAFADVVINEPGNTIIFTDNPGIIEFEESGSAINFSNGGSITGLTSLMVDSVIAGNTIMNNSGIVIIDDRWS